MANGGRNGPLPTFRFDLCPAARTAGVKLITRAGLTTSVRSGFGLIYYSNAGINFAREMGSI